MIKLNWKEYGGKGSYQKNILYKISGDTIIPFTETHEGSADCERVDLRYLLHPGQYGIFAYEYRNPVISKQGCKTADVQTCVVDEGEKKITTFICDVKSNISAFSDNLLKDNALLTVIKEVRDFAEQIKAEILHKNSFILYYKAEGFVENENIGIVTKRFEKEKFAAAADMLESLFQKESPSVPKLLEIKLKNNLGAYRNEVNRIRDFSRKKVLIFEKPYDLKVILLEKISDTEYKVSIEISLC